jgi:PleD family two-component response regulator
MSEPQETSFQQEGSTLPLPSFSAGLSLYRPGETPESFIQRADHAMYRAKRSRNTYKFYEDSVSTND